MKIETTNILENAVLFSLTRRAWGNVARGDMGHIVTDSNASDDKVVKARLKLGKVLIAECPELDAIYDEQGRIYKWCLDRSFDSCLREGVYFVGKNMIADFEREIAASNQLINEQLVPAFLAVYPAAIDKAREQLKEQFNGNNYPPEGVMRNKFSVEHSWLEFNVPKDLPEDVKKREAKKLEAKFAEAGQEVIYGLREGMAEFIADLTRRLAPEPGQKGKRFTAPGAIENLREFLGRFKALNFANDVELAKLADQAKAIVDSGDANRVAVNYQARQNLRAKFAELGQNVGKLIGERPGRRFDLD